MIAAAVLVGLVGGQRPGVVLTRRAKGLRLHGGQIAFPGGRIDPGDEGPEGAALREAEEEIGLDPGCVRVLGRLAPVVTVSGFAVVPVVAQIAAGAAFRLAMGEVEAVFVLPLAVVLDPAAPRWHQGDRSYWVWSHAEHVIWGATAQILIELAILLKARPGALPLDPAGVGQPQTPFLKERVSEGSWPLAGRLRSSMGQSPGLAFSESL